VETTSTARYRLMARVQAPPLCSVLSKRKPRAGAPEDSRASSGLGAQGSSGWGITAGFAPAQDGPGCPREGQHPQHPAGVDWLPSELARQLQNRGSSSAGRGGDDREPQAAGSSRGSSSREPGETGEHHTHFPQGPAVKHGRGRKGERQRAGLLRKHEPVRDSRTAGQAEGHIAQRECV